MGRYLRGTDGFSYKYAFAAQDDNLGELADAMGAGTTGLVPSFGGGYTSIETNFDIAVIPLLRAIQQDGLARDGDIDRVVPPGTSEALRRPTLEFVQYALGENIVEVARRLDLQLEDIPMGVELEGYATLELTRDDYPAALAYINQLVTTPLTLADLHDAARVDATSDELGDTQGYLPAMALAIVRHAATHDLASISVRESTRSSYAPDFWSGVAEWGPSIFYSNTPATGAEWFARGLVELFGGDPTAARTSLEAAAAAGFAQAGRWVEHLARA